MFCEGGAMRKLAALLLLVTLPAVAEEAPRKAKAEEPGTHVDMPFLIAPMSGADGKLLGYTYVSSKITTSSPAASVEVRDKLAFIQDAFVRDVNAAPIATAEDPAKVDVKLLAGRLVADARRIVGKAKIVAIAFKQLQFSPLHPKLATDALPPDARAPAQAAAAQKTP
jgi:hypothetical protein